MLPSRLYTLEVSGPMACFTRPELKVERVSYEVITPSAARAVFEAVYWTPGIRWRILRIAVLHPISFLHICRCEVASAANTKKDHIIAENHRQFRNSLLLRDPSYCLTALMEVSDAKPEKHFAIFERRSSRGQCFTQPYLGCREFSATWRRVEGELSHPIAESRDLGMMLHDMDFSDPEAPRPQFFRAIMHNGVIDIPPL